MLDLKVLAFIIGICVLSANGDDDECNEIVPRRDWGASPATHFDYQNFPIGNVIIADTSSRTCTSLAACSEYVRVIQNYHKTDLKFNDIGYNFLMGNDGRMYEGVGWHTVGAYSRGWNSKSVVIGFIGNFNEELPTQAALDACKKLLDCGVETGKLTPDYKLLGHMQIKATQSPGLRLYNKNQYRDNLENLIRSKRTP